VLATLTPAERLAFVLHDLFAMPFDEIGSIMGGRRPRQSSFASRARRRVRARERRRRRQGGSARSRGGVSEGGARRDLEACSPCSIRTPSCASTRARFDGVVRIRCPAADAGKARELKGASTWAAQLIALSRGIAIRPAGPRQRIDRRDPRAARRAVPGAIFRFRNDKITRLEAIGDPARLRQLDIAVL